MRIVDVIKRTIADLNDCDPKARHLSIAITCIENGLLRLDCYERQFLYSPKSSLPLASVVSEPKELFEMTTEVTPASGKVAKKRGRPRKNK